MADSSLWLLRRPPVRAVFAVGTTTAQFVWRPASDALTSVTIGETSVAASETGGPGALIVEGLRPGTEYEAAIDHGDRSRATVRFRTLDPPPGAELCRIATLNDLHLGCAHFGYTSVIRERPAPAEPSSDRCARAAVEEMRAWKPDYVVFKGDVVHRGTAREWNTAAQLAAELPQPVGMVFGNHEVRTRRQLEPDRAARDRSFEIADPVTVRDHAGVRLVLVDTSVDGEHYGRIAHATDDVADAIAGADGPAVVLLHHNLQRHPVATFLPRGIPRRESAPFLDAVAAANPATIVTSGHTHRHRRRVHNGIAVVEVGSPKDYPGVWCGMIVHEGGVRHEVRRVMRPDCLAWTERTRRAALGFWGRWSPGLLGDRCFSHTWADAADG